MRVDVIPPSNVQESEVRPRAVGRTGPIWAGRQLGLTDQLLFGVLSRPSWTRCVAPTRIQQHPEKLSVRARDEGKGGGANHVTLGTHGTRATHACHW